MFATFPYAPSSASSTSHQAKHKPKRCQVARACVWCRTYRIKCDAKVPCSNCESKGRTCTADTSKSEIRTYPSAIKEIDRLRDRIKELEGQISNFSVQGRPSALLGVPNGDAIGIKQENDVLPEELDPLGQHGAHRNYYNWSFSTQTTRAGSHQAHGSSSIFYFADRLSSYLNKGLQVREPLASNLHATLPGSVAPTLHDVLTNQDSVGAYSQITAEDLQRSNEEQLLRLYWKYTHVYYPVLDKDAFEAYHDSLWAASETLRNPSALVDILIALCLQQDATRVEVASRSHQNFALFTSRAAPTAGRWFFRRCQNFLQDELEEPTITTFQCYALSVLWLARASLQTAAHNTLAAGLRVGVVLGLHIEPSISLSPLDPAFRRRLWWTVYSLDVQYAMDYGRPLGVAFGQVTCTLPKDDTSPKSEGSATSFNTQMIRLILASRAIYILFHRVCAKTLRQSRHTDMHQTPDGVETCADWLEENLRYLNLWVAQVPEGMKTPREGFGQAYSTDHSRFDLTDASYAHYLVLELHYHLSAMSLYRPIITFVKRDLKMYAATERMAVRCADHAITAADIIHQDVKVSCCLRDWRNICSDLLSTALTLVGYVLAYPYGPVAVAARQTIDTAIEDMNILSPTSPTTESAVIVLRSLVDQLDRLLAEEQSKSLARLYEIPVAPSISDRISQDQEVSSPVENVANDIEPPSIKYSRPVSARVLPELNIFEENMTSEEWLNSLFNFEEE